MVHGNIYVAINIKMTENMKIKQNSKMRGTMYHYHGAEGAINIKM
jgi:hypothetical protein